MGCRREAEPPERRCSPRAQSGFPYDLRISNMTSPKASERKRGTKPEKNSCPGLSREIGEAMGGSKLNDFNAVVGTQAFRTIWTANSNEEEFGQQRAALIAAMIGIRPIGELEGMLAAQM